MNLTYRNDHTCKSIMVQGTASAAGKSLIATALCRIFHQDGFRVAPFKAQNMSNNSFVTNDGQEMGRAQVVQAYAAGLLPEVRMNPVLLKPSSDMGQQVVLEGKPVFTISGSMHQENREQLYESIGNSYESLAGDYEVIVLEGAGSPAEINLKESDLVNMGMAKRINAPVIIVGDIDRGGVFASLVGTMQLFEEDERRLVKGFVINKFRGNVDLLKPGLTKLEKLTGVPVLGVVPWVDHAIDDEDGVTQRFDRRDHSPAEVDICIIRLPHISNFTDFIPLEAVPGVSVRWCDTKGAIGSPDLLILPGTKATIADLQMLRDSGIAQEIINYAKEGGNVFGVCGGFQMLGKTILDPEHSESKKESEEGLSLLDMKTVFHAEKQTEQVSVTINGSGSWLCSDFDGSTVSGYEIHMGLSEYGPTMVPFTRNGTEVNGIADPSGRILGTYVHGLFDSSKVTAGIINSLRKSKGLPVLDNEVIERGNVLERDIETLAGVVRESLDIDAIYRIAGISHDPT